MATTTCSEKFALVPGLERVFHTYLTISSYFSTRFFFFSFTEFSCSSSSSSSSSLNSRPLPSPPSFCKVRLRVLEEVITRSSHQLILPRALRFTNTRRRRRRRRRRRHWRRRRRKRHWRRRRRKDRRIRRRKDRRRRRWILTSKGVVH
jgi:hypothetical protein